MAANPAMTGQDAAMITLGQAIFVFMQSHNLTTSRLKDMLASRGLDISESDIEQIIESVRIPNKQFILLLGEVLHLFPSQIDYLERMREAVVVHHENLSAPITEGIQTEHPADSLILSNDAFGKIIKEARGKAGLTQRQLADLVGASDGYITHVEKGVSLPSQNFERGLLRALNFDSEQQEEASGILQRLREQRHIQKSRTKYSMNADDLGVAVDTPVEGPFEKTVPNDAFGIIIKRAREKAGLTQRELGNLVGYTDGYIAHVEKGVKLPSQDLERGLLRALNFDSEQQRALSLTLQQLREQTRIQRSRIRNRQMRDEAMRADQINQASSDSAMRIDIAKFFYHRRYANLS